MALHPLAGKPAPKSLLVDIPKLVAAFYDLSPDPENHAHKVSFGTSGHRGVSTKNSFNRNHILAITQAVCEHRKEAQITGPLFLGMDTHALSFPAFTTALEVLAAYGVQVVIQKDLGYTPTPVISHAILTAKTKNLNGNGKLADGIVITPSHNPPESGGFKYNPPHGGPADTTVTEAIENRANQLLNQKNLGENRVPFERALKAETTHEYDYIGPYVDDLKNVIDMDAIRSGGLKIGVDPMGGSGFYFWQPIADRYGFDLEVVNQDIEPDFRFMTVDRDGKIRMDCSSPYAMASLVGLKDRFDIAFGNDPDYDRHGIVTRQGLMNPNHFLAVSIKHLIENRPRWKADIAIGKTLVSSGMIDRVVASLERPLCEVPVGFKWFVQGLNEGSICFGGEESAGASFLRKDGSVWTTDKDGFIMDLLAAEITVRAGKSPSEIYNELTEKFGSPQYERLEAPANSAQKSVLKKLTPDHVEATTLAGESIETKLTQAPGNDADIGGLKVTTKNGWFAARPSGTEDVYKIYTESFIDKNHLRRIQEEAQAIVGQAFKSAGV